MTTLECATAGCCECRTKVKQAHGVAPQGNVHATAEHGLEVRRAAARQAVIDSAIGVGSFYNGPATKVYLAVRAALRLQETD